MLSLRTSLEHFLYLLIAFLINLILFSLLYFFVFYISIPPQEKFSPLRVEIKEIASLPGGAAEKPTEKVEKPKAPKVAKTEQGTKLAPQAPKATKMERATPELPVSEKGQIPVKAEKKPEESVSVLEEIRGRALERLKEREKLAKEVGEISAVVSQGKLTLKAGSRKLVYVPPPPTFRVREFPSAVKVKIWVDPSGKVVRAIILQRSGIAEVDEGLLRFARKLMFEPIETGELQEGVIIFTFVAD